MPQSGVMPEAKRSGEPDGSRKRKRPVENPEDVDIEQPRRTRGLRQDYCYLSNPFGYEGEEEVTNLLEETYAIIAGDEVNSLNDAKGSQDCPERRKTIG